MTKMNNKLNGIPYTYKCYKLSPELHTCPSCKINSNQYLIKSTAWSPTSIAWPFNIPLPLKKQYLLVCLDCKQVRFINFSEFNQYKKLKENTPVIKCGHSTSNVTTDIRKNILACMAEVLK